MSQIPYATPLPGDGRPPNPRPTAVLVIAILGIVLGAFGMLGGLCGILANVVNVNNANPAMEAMYHDLAWRMVLLASTSLQFILSVILVIGSVYLLSLRPWARRLLLGYGWGQLGVWALMTLTNVLWIIPRMSHLLSGQTIDPTQRKMMHGRQLFGLLCGLLWPLFAVVVLILLTRPGVKAAFTGRALPPSGQAPPAPPDGGIASP
jgi:hypothetical protein